MKQFGEHKWLAVVAGIAILLSVGAIAWSAVAWTEAKQDPDPDGIGARLLLREGVGSRVDDAAPPAGMTGGGKDRRGAAEELRERGIERLVVLLENVRDEMTAEDQEQYDLLVEAFKDQRIALQEATQELAGTLKELRALAAEYLGPESGGTE